MDFLTSFLGRSGYLPHGYCFTWTPGLLWSMVGADAIVATAYFSIPLAITTFLRQRADISMRPVAWLFSAFIFACGLTHVMDIWTIWQPDYGLQVLTKVVTAVISIVTAIALWPLIPKALKIPSVNQLQTVIKALEAEVQKRRSAEDHLGDVQQNLAVTLASVEAGFIAIDRAGRVTRMNAVAERVLGWGQAEAQGQSLWRVFERENRPASDAERNPVDVMIEQDITVGTAQHVVAIARDGTRTALEMKAGLTYADDGTVRGMAMLFRDMTQLIHAEAESRRLAAIVESSIDAIVGQTLDGRITDWNGAAHAMFGYTADEAVGQPVQMLIPAEREVEEQRLLAGLAQGANVPAFDSVLRTKDGTPLEVSVTISPIRDRRGRLVGASRIARDVSHLRRAEAALRESEARLRFTLESAQIGDWDLDLVSGTARRSLRHDRCFGYDRLQDDWDFETFLRHVHPDDRAEVVGRIQAGTSALRDWSGEYRVVWPDASIHWVRTHCTIQHEAGRPTHMLGIVSDITQQKLAEEMRLKSLRLEAENRQIQEASRLKSQFLANMSHELRTPLNAIIGFADLLRSGAVPPASRKHDQFLDHIGTSGRHLLQLINDVLDLSKVESGKFEFFPEPVDLPLLIDEAVGILHTATAKKGIAIATEVDPTLTGIVLDSARLKQALYNFLSNAIKFTPEGGHVSVRALPEGPAHLRIEVQDTGIGIAAADLPRLFVEFQQLDAGSTKQHPGTGLGLALTRRLVQAQGGSVGVRSTPGMGSTFYMVLKRVHGPDVAHLPAPADDEARAHRVLVIEDERQVRADLVQALSDVGFRVDAASTGQQAVQHALAHAYDAITLDLLLPDRNGLDVLASIRSAGPSRASPVVGVSMPAEAGAAARFSIANVLCKPIRSAEIVAAMARFRGAPSQRAKVMVIDDDPLALDLMHATLSGIGIDTVCLLDGRLALAEIDQHRPDAIILDLMMPTFDGFAVLDALRRLSVWRDTPVFIWTSMILSADEYASLARSAREILSKGGGELEALLETLREWRPPLAALPQGDAS